MSDYELLHYEIDQKRTYDVFVAARVVGVESPEIIGINSLPAAIAEKDGEAGRLLHELLNAYGEFLEESKERYEQDKVGKLTIEEWQKYAQNMKKREDTMRDFYAYLFKLLQPED